MSGIEIISQIKPKNGQTFGIIDCNDLIGGYIQVDELTDLNSFPTKKIKEGMLAYVKNDDHHLYQSISNAWIKASLGGSSGTQLSISTVDTLSDLSDSSLLIKGNVVYVEETDDLRYYTGTVTSGTPIWYTFNKIYIQSTAPTDLNGIWIDTTDNGFNDSNTVIQSIISAISVLQTAVNNLEFAFTSEIDLGDFTNNKISIYDNSTAVEPGTSTSISQDITEEEPTQYSSTLPNAVHLAIKAGTYAQMVANKDKFVGNELLWCYDTKALYIKDKVSNTLINIGTQSGNSDDTVDGILTKVVGTGSSATTKIVGVEFADINDNTLTYLLRVKDGSLDLHDYRLDTNSLAGNAQTVASGEYYSIPYFPISSDNTGNTTSPMIYINMIYCGNDDGSTSYNYCSHNFIELANLTNEDINLKGLYLHYTERDFGKWISLPLKGVIKSKSTFLIRGAQCSYLDTNTTKINVSTYDMLWDKSSTYNSTVLEDSNDSHSVWDSSSLLKMASNCSLYISGEESTDYYSSNVLSVDPWNILGCLKWYVDLVGVGTYNSTAMPCETTQIAVNDTNKLLVRYYSMDDVSQAIPAFSKRKNSTDWTYIDLANTNSAIDISDYVPKASSQNKNIFFDKHLITDGVPNVVTCTFGWNAHTTRCFNWISKGYYDEYILISEVSGDYTNAVKHESFKSTDGRTSSTNRDNAIYNRIRWITSDGTSVTTHKIILDFTEPTAGTTKTYYYKVGRDGYYTDERSFTLKNRSDVITSGFNFCQVTDQQGFKGEEYETWKLAANYIVGDKSNHGYDFVVNTGDIAQNGNRINEWLDYFNAGNNMFKDTVQMFTVGNNDLCEVDPNTLIDGSDTSKVNPIYTNYFFTFEHPYTVPVSTNGTYLCSNYSFIYGNTFFLSVNSEITETTRTSIYGDTTTNVYDTIKTWCDNEVSKIDSNIKWRIAFCHDTPINIVTANTIYSFSVSDGSGGYTTVPSVTRGGSHLNTVGGYWFSKFLQDNAFKACFGGHKHTYAITRPVYDNANSTMQPYVYDASDAPSWYTALPDRHKKCVTLSTDTTKNYVRYLTCQATGYKLISNKELPAQNIPWCLDWYPDTESYNSTTNTITSSVNMAQEFPHYMIYNIGSGTETVDGTNNATSRDRILANGYKVVLTATPTTNWWYKYNTPITLSQLTKAGGNGSTNPNNNIIIE